MFYRKCFSNLSFHFNVKQSILFCFVLASGAFTYFEKPPILRRRVLVGPTQIKVVLGRLPVDL